MHAVVSKLMEWGVERGGWWMNGWMDGLMDASLLCS